MDIGDSHSLRFPLLLGLLWYPDEPVHRDRAENIEDNKSPQVGEVVPSLVVEGIDVCQEDVGVLKGTQAALRRRVLSPGLEVTTSIGYVGFEIRLAGLTGRRIEVEIFDVGTDDLRICEAR